MVVEKCIVIVPVFCLSAVLLPTNNQPISIILLKLNVMLGPLGLLVRRTG